MDPRSGGFTALMDPYRREVGAERAFHLLRRSFVVLPGATPSVRAKANGAASSANANRRRDAMRRSTIAAVHQVAADRRDTAELSGRNRRLRVPASLVQRARPGAQAIET
jgi:hypothetical protein